MAQPSRIRNPRVTGAGGMRVMDETRHRRDLQIPVRLRPRAGRLAPARTRHHPCAQPSIPRFLIGGAFLPSPRCLGRLQRVGPRIPLTDDCTVRTP